MPARTTRKPTTQNKEKVEAQGPAPDPTAELQAAMEIFVDDWGDLNLHGKLAVISGFLGRIPKNGYNKFNDYRYVLESDLVETIRYYLAAARILIYPKRFVSHTVYTFDGVTTGENRRQRDALTDNVIEYEVIDGKTGESFTFEVNGQGSDPRDKGANKASTSAMKFGYLRLFNISSGEDEAEGDSHGDQQQQANEEPRQARQQRPQVEPGGAPDAQRGGKQEKATSTQIKAISNLSNQLELGAIGLVAVIKRVLDEDVTLPDDEKEHGPTLAKYLTSKTGEDVGKLIYALQEMVKAARDEGDPSDGYGN